MFKIILRVLWLLSHQKRLVCWLVISNFVFAGLTLLEPIFFKEVIDILISLWGADASGFSDLYSTLTFWIWVWILTIFIRLFISIFADKLAHFDVNKNVFSFFSHALNLSMRFHMNSNSGELVKKITKGIDWIFEVQLNFFRRALPNIVIILMLIPLVLYFNIKLWFFLIITWIISAIITWYLATKTFQKQWAIEDIYSWMSAHYGDTFSNIQIIKSFSLAWLKSSELKQQTDNRLIKQLPILYWWGSIISIFSILKIIISIGIIFFGSYLFLQWEVTIGEIVMFLSFSSIFLSSIEDLTWVLEGLFWRLAGIRDYFEIIDTQVEVQDKKDAKELSNIKGNVVFQNLGFSYDGKRTVLNDINMDIKPWEKVAFVGHTGSGKTTMTNMLLRFFEPQKGRVLIDGTDISNVTQDSLRKNIGVVFQDNSLFNTTIENNIKLDKLDTGREELEKIIEKAHAWEFIAQLSDGLDTLVWERGVKLSGWEKQRLAIARAFLKDAPILVLDEATSALDAETERYLQGSFDELMKGRTTFIIAHRLSTIKKADRIFVFDGGKIIEQGSYQNLVAKKGSFAKLVAAQVEGFIE